VVLRRSIIKCIGIVGQGKKSSRYILNELAKTYGIEQNDNKGFLIRDEDGNIRKAEISDIKNLFEEELK